MELTRQSVEDADITAESEVLIYEYTGTTPIEVLVRVDLGDAAGPLSGAGGAYLAAVYVNGVVVSPSAAVTLAAGVTKTILVSRSLPLQPDDVISVRARGQAGDTDVNVVTSIRDATPAKASDLVGSGPIEINHNYGGTDNYRVVNSSGDGIGGVSIQAFLTSDYLAERRTSAFVRGRTTTNVTGRWQSSIFLDPEDYTLVISKSGSHVATTRTLTVE